MSTRNKRGLFENDRALGNFWAEENTEKSLLNLYLSQDTCRSSNSQGLFSYLYCNVSPLILGGKRYVPC